ncbi:MAG TPA: hypothetical protein VKE74_27890 [Gemmataceae bacterium]|nr:hypothetical protein [Gemmataceae bacterium]
MARTRDKDRPTSTKPTARNDAYTMMLFITFVAIVTGCVLLYLDFDEYGQQKAPTTALPTVQKLGEAPAAGTTGPSTGPGTKTGGDTGTKTGDGQ